MKTTRITDIDACRMDIIRAAMQTDSIEVLNKMRHAYRRAAATSPAPYTLEEIKERTECSRADINAGRVMTWAEADQKLKQELPWLK